MQSRVDVQQQAKQLPDLILEEAYQSKALRQNLLLLIVYILLLWKIVQGKCTLQF